MTTISCKLPESLAARLDAAARRQRCSKSALLRNALEKSLKPPKKKRVTALDLVGHLRGSVPIDIPDLSTNPEHMRGFGE